MININNQHLNFIKIGCFILFSTFKVFADKAEVDAVVDNNEIKYKNPFIYNLTDPHFDEIVNKNDTSIFSNFDTTFLYILLFFLLTLCGLKFLITVISKQIKEEMNNDYMII